MSETRQTFCKSKPILTSSISNRYLTWSPGRAEHRVFTDSRAALMKSKHVSSSSIATITGWRQTTAGWQGSCFRTKKICPSWGFPCLFCQVRSPLSLRAQSGMEIAFPHQCGVAAINSTHFYPSDRDGFQNGHQIAHGRGVPSTHPRQFLLPDCPLRG